jgi:hypothetical protein
MNRKLLLRSAMLLTVTLPAWAHEGHGLGAPHAHSGDLLVLLVLGVAAGAWLWLRGRK